MAGAIRFQINLVTSGNVLPEVSERLKDLRPVFAQIVRKWAEDNEDKFRMSQGAEVSGAEIDPGVFWQALKPGTMKAKRRLGYANQIMVATGQLRSAMVDPEGFFHEETATQAAFGTPKDELDEMKIVGNLKRSGRQVIFLSVDDQRMIDKQVHDYLVLGGNWQTVMFAKGMEAVNRREESAQMDMGFGDAMEKE